MYASTTLLTPAIAPALAPDLGDLLRQLAILLNNQPEEAQPGFGIDIGRGGLVLFNCHYAAYSGETAYYDRARTQFEQALREINPHTYCARFGTSYYQELAELGNLVCYLNSHGHLDWDAAPLLAQLDLLLETRLEHHLKTGKLEIVNGALSAGTYFLRRYQQSAVAHRSLHRLLDALVTLREGDKASGYYWTCHVIVEPRVYTGLSHGSAMILNFLTALHERGIRPVECADLLHYGLKFLLTTRMDPDQFLSSFPLWRGNEEVTNNLCLVYGDVGTAYAAIRAAQRLGHAEYEAEATRIALRTVQRTNASEAFLYDASVWYGAGGSYLLYDSVFRQTGRIEFAEAARYWLNRIPEMAQHDNEYLGFNSYFFHKHPTAQLSFKFGLTGIGLVLLQALSNSQYVLDEFVWLA